MSVTSNTEFILGLIGGLRTWSEQISASPDPITVPGPDGTEVELDSTLLDYADALFRALNGNDPDESERVLLGTETLAE